MKNEILQGMRSALPITLGYVPIGLAFGILAVQQGLSIGEITLMSLIVYAGSAQFIAAAMLAGGAAALTVVSAVFLVNLRHLLMSAAYSPLLKGMSLPLQGLIGLSITDETFSVGITSAVPGKTTGRFFLGLHITAHLSWLISTVLGGAAGSRIPDPALWGLEFALPAMFIGLLILQLKNKVQWLVAFAAGLLSLTIASAAKGNAHIIIATVLAAVLGVFLERWTCASSISCSE